MRLWNGHAAIKRAMNDVLGEMDREGLLTEPVYDVEVVSQLVDVGPLIINYDGCYVPEVSLVQRALGFEADSIYIPATSGARLWRALIGIGRDPTSLRDVLRHEYGHAFAVHHPKLIDTPKFERVFGASYDDAWDEPDYDPGVHVTPYAATAPCEDFAECFMMFLKYRDPISRHRSRPRIAGRLRFIAGLVRALRRSPLRVSF